MTAGDGDGGGGGDDDGGGEYTERMLTVWSTAP